MSAIILSTIERIIDAYDLISLPIYTIFQQPDKTIQLRDRIRAKRIIPTDPYSSLVRAEPDSTSWPFIKECKTLPELFYKSVQHFKDRRCLGHRECFGVEDETQADGKTARKYNLGDYIWYSYAEVQLRVDHIREGLSEAGVRPGDHVVIFSETRIEWHLAAQALLQLQAVVVTLYSTLTDEGIVHGINECEACHVITSSALVPKLSKLHDKITRVRCVIYFEGPETIRADKYFVELIPFQSIELNGQRASRTLYPTPSNQSTVSGKQRLPSVKPEQVAVIMYTSGTTGTPKGVMMTHRNILHGMRSLFFTENFVFLKSGRHTYMSYLPLAHILAFVSDLAFLAHGARIGYSSPATMSDVSTGIRGDQRGDAALLQPTVMASVPLVWDRFRAGIIQQFSTKGPFFDGFLNFVVRYKNFWSHKGFSTPMLNFVFCRKLKSLLGGQLRLIFCGGAPLAAKTQEFIEAVLDIKILQGYGLTESSAALAAMDFDDVSTGAVGPPLQGVCVRLVDWDEGDYCVTDGPLPRGELVVGGDSVAAGYFKRPEETAQLFHCDEDGKRWFFTGDIVEIQANGNLKIIDRKKDLVKLLNGEYISLTRIETELRTSEYVDNICVLGAGSKNCLVALIAANRKSIEKLASSLGCEDDSFDKLCDNQGIVSQVAMNLAECARSAGLHRVEIPARYKLCPEEWLPATGLVTGALKLKRKSIEAFYKKQIDDLYAQVD